MKETSEVPCRSPEPQVNRPGQVTGSRQDQSWEVAFRGPDALVQASSLTLRRRVAECRRKRSTKKAKRAGGPSTAGHLMC